MSKSPIEVVQRALQAYVNKDRAAIEALIGADYHFTSPYDNRIDRATYFDRCWPNSKHTAGFELIHEIADGDRVFVVYEGKTDAGKVFRNCEMHRVRDGELIETEVYFGWDLPHEAPEGSFIDPS
jgi:ketosteroid isomerase-like protein